MTREQALEAALRSAPDFGGEPKTPFGREYREWQQQARAALAMPPDGVNADMLAALQSVVGVYEGHEDVPIYVRKARAAIARATGKQAAN